jgi:hypothetical protein
MALCPPPLFAPLFLGFCFLGGRSAKRLRKLPARCPFKSPEPGPRHTPGQACPCPSHSGCPTPCQIHPTRPQGSPGSSVAPSRGHVGRSSSPSRMLELHSGTRHVADAGGAKLHTGRLPQPRLRSSVWLSGTREREFTRSAWLPGYSILLPFSLPALPQLRLILLMIPRSPSF